MAEPMLRCLFFLSLLFVILTGCAPLLIGEAPPESSEPLPVEEGPEPVATVPVSEASDQQPAEGADTANADEVRPRFSDNAEVEPEDMPVASVPEPVSGPEPAQQPETEDSKLLQVPVAEAPGDSPLIARLCEEIGGKLGSVSVSDCAAQSLRFDGAVSVNKRPLALKEFLPREAEPSIRVLILGGIHGDEYSSISIMFKWMELLDENNTAFHWRFIPTANPDGLLDGKAVRQNANGVDLNRNFPTRDWLDLAQKSWVENTGRNPRRYPGVGPASEPEVQWLVGQIESFAPDVIVSVHAPYHLLDFDGPSEAPDKIGELYLHQLGVYPGSLGNYGGVDLGIPVVTLELPSAGIMPAREQIESMWGDLNDWLHNNRLNLSAR